MFLKPSVDEVHAFLARESALLVHFSGVPRGVPAGPERIFPEDLQFVIAGGAQTGVSCSVVRATDRFHGKPRNSIGAIGVVLDVITPESLIAVGPSDVGSHIVDGRRVAIESDITVEDLENSLRLRTEHNEWVVRDFIVGSIFAVDPLEYFDRRQDPPYCYTTLPELAAMFPGRPIIHVKAGQVSIHNPAQSQHKDKACTAIE